MNDGVKLKLSVRLRVPFTIDCEDAAEFSVHLLLLRLPAPSVMNGCSEPLSAVNEIWFVLGTYWKAQLLLNDRLPLLASITPSV